MAAPHLAAKLAVMKNIRISYLVAGRATRREFLVRFDAGDATERSVARAILAHEFAEVIAPFGLADAFTAQQALARFAVTDVKTSLAESDERRGACQGLAGQ